MRVGGGACAGGGWFEGARDVVEEGSGVWKEAGGHVGSASLYPLGGGRARVGIVSNRSPADEMSSGRRERRPGRYKREED